MPIPPPDVLSDLDDVDIIAPVDLDLMQFDGAKWVARSLSEAGIPDTQDIADLHTELSLLTGVVADFSAEYVAHLAADSHGIYHNDARANAWLATKTTDNLTEGVGNLYYSNTRARLALSAAAPLAYDNATGAFTFTTPGATTQVLFNDAGAFGGDGGLTYVAGTDRLTVAGSLVTPSIVGSVASAGSLTLKSTEHATKGSIYCDGLVGVNKLSAIGAQLHVVPNAIGVIGLLIDGAASQTASLFQLRDSAGAVFLDSGKGLASSAFVINEQGADIDFRVEGDTNTNLLFTDASTDLVGVGILPTAGRLHVSRVFSGSIPSSYRGLYVQTDAEETVASNALEVTGIYSLTRVTAGNTQNLTNAQGINSCVVGVRTLAGSVGTITAMSVVNVFDMTNGGANTITAFNGIKIAAATNTGGGTITGLAGIAMANQTVGTKNTNLLIGTLTIPTGNYSIYNSSAYDNYFAGNVGIGVISPLSPLHVASPNSISNNLLYDAQIIRNLGNAGTYVRIGGDASYPNYVGAAFGSTIGPNGGVSTWSGSAYVMRDNGSGFITYGGRFRISTAAINTTKNIAYTSKSDALRQFIFTTDYDLWGCPPGAKFLVGATTYTVKAAAGDRVTVVEDITAEAATGTLTAIPYAPTWLQIETTGPAGFMGGTGTSPAARLQMAGNLSAASWLTSGMQLRADAAIYTNTSTGVGGTAVSAVFNSFAIPTLAATNTGVITTDAATVYIAGAPANGTNQTITNPWSLWVDTGNSRFDGLLDLSNIVAGAANLKITATSDSPTVTWGAAAGNEASTAPAGYMEINVGGNARYIPYWA